MTQLTEQHATHREVELLEILRGLGGSARTVALAEALDVSEETVRRTVKALAKAGLVQRVHGGVYLTNKDAQTPVASRLGKQSSEKAQIARKAAKLIPDGACVFLDVGSTTAYVAEALQSHKDLTVVTNALTPTMSLIGRNGNRVFVAGGEARDVELGTFGAATLQFLEKFNVDIAVLSVDGIDPNTGFLLANFEEAEVSRLMTRQSRRCVMVVDNSKFGQTAAHVAASPQDIDVLITDKPLRPVFHEAMAGWDIEVKIAQLDGQNS